MRPIPAPLAAVGFIVAALVAGTVYGLETLRERIGRRR